MVDMPYSGTVLRASHFDSRPSVPGVNDDHFKPDPEVDPFNPVPDTPPNQAGTILNQDEPFHANGYRTPSLADQPFTHWYDGQPAVPSGVETAARMQAMQERFILDHSDANYVPDQIRLYQHASEGYQSDEILGRLPREAGATIPDGPLAGLQNGKNGYDATNDVSEIYSGDPANVGRYRVGRQFRFFGLYDMPLAKNGQDAMLHAYTGIRPQFPANKRQMTTDAAPYTPNSSGANGFWGPAAPNQVPSMFGLPSETVMTDRTVATGGFIQEDTGSEFEDRGWF